MGLFSGRGKKRDQEQQDVEALRWLTKLAREDLLELGERLDDETPPTQEGALAERAQATTLTAQARPRLREAETTEAVLAVQETIGQAFVHLARSDAIVRGEEPPTRTDPCEFNPQHGPASTQVQWAAVGAEPKAYACCRPDADLIAQGLAPRFRQIKVGGVSVAWQDLRDVNLSRADRRDKVLSTNEGYAMVAARLASIQTAGTGLTGGRP